ncbi:MAG: FIST C-terminal domain-containing protein [Saprospiraceae bacterium]|jgi:hypothetical protein|nr:FIST C-terminal domain-containing protein [Saprospiraceae bacterium]
MLRFHSASNGIVNSRKAIEECIEKALGGEDLQRCRLILFHSSIAHDFSQILSRAAELCPQAVLAGCTCAGVIGVEGANESMKALGIMAALSDDPEEIVVSYCDNIRGDNSFEASRAMAQELKALNPKVNMVHILASGIDIAADRAIEGIESVFGPEVTIFGGTSSDNMKALTSFQFYNQKILERGAVLVGFADPTLSAYTGVHHGNTPIGIPFVVTQSEKNRVVEIDGRPAWPYLMQMLGLPVSTHPGQTIPIAGLAELLPDELHAAYDNQHVLRVIVKVDDEHQSFYMPVDCPAGTRLWLTKRDEQLIFDGLSRMLGKLTRQIEDKEVVGVFHTDCGARGRTLFNKILKEEIIHLMQYPIIGDKNTAWLGMYGFGEFTPLDGRNFFHNYTTCICALCRNKERS